MQSFTDREKANGGRLANISDAKVYIYIGNTLIRSYKVPRNQTGNTWVVFMIDESGSFQDINKFYDSSTWEAVGEQLAVLRLG